jgi:hypothetical protein
LSVNLEGVGHEKQMDDATGHGQLTGSDEGHYMEGQQARVLSISAVTNRQCKLHKIESISEKDSLNCLVGNNKCKTTCGNRTSAKTVSN